MGAGSGDLSGLEHRGLSFTLLIYNLPDVGLPLESDRSILLRVFLRINVIGLSQEMTSGFVFSLYCLLFLLCLYHIYIHVIIFIIYFSISLDLTCYFSSILTLKLEVLLFNFSFSLLYIFKAKRS